MLINKISMVVWFGCMIFIWKGVYINLVFVCWILGFLVMILIIFIGFLFFKNKLKDGKYGGKNFLKKLIDLEVYVCLYIDFVDVLFWWLWCNFWE